MQKIFEPNKRVPSFEVCNESDVLPSKEGSISSCSCFQEVNACHWAAIPQFTHTDVLDVPADLGGHCKLKGWGCSIEGGRIVEEREDDIVLTRGHLAGGEVADESPVALFWLNLGNCRKLEGIVVHGGPLASVAVATVATVAVALIATA